MSYNVAFRHTAAAEAYAGVITWTTFPSKEEFDKWYSETPDALTEQEIVEEGISKERCIELARSTPIESRNKVAISMATNPVTGRINLDVLRMELTKASYGS